MTSPSVYTLSEHLKFEKDKFRAGVINAALERVKVAELIPFQTIGTFNIKANRWLTLPQPQFRNLGTAFTATAGNSEQLEETVYAAGGNVDIEELYTEDKNVTADPMSNQMDMFMTAMSLYINGFLINGDVASDPAGFNGIKLRVGNLAARQSIVAATNGLDVRASLANELTFFDKLDQLIDLVDDGKCDALLMNTTSRLGIRSALRRAGLFETTRDMFDREVMVYRGAQIIDMGQTLATAMAPTAAGYIITDTETEGGSGAVCTSIYAVRFGRDAGEYLTGIDMFPMRTRDIGLLENGQAYRKNVEWPLGLANWHPRSMARMTGVAWTS